MKVGDGTLKRWSLLAGGRFSEVCLLLYVHFVANYLLANVNNSVKEKYKQNNQNLTDSSKDSEDIVSTCAIIPTEMSFDT